MMDHRPGAPRPEPSLQSQSRGCTKAKTLTTSLGLIEHPLDFSVRANREYEEFWVGGLLFEADALKIRSVFTLR